MGVLREFERNLRHRLRGERVRSQGHILFERLSALEREVEALKRLAAEPLVERARRAPAGTPLADVEFRVSSQFGEDGILQHLCAHVPLPQRTFIEFGVEDFREANCRFLAERDAWSGLVLDGDPALQRNLARQALWSLRSLRARSAFVTAENVDELFTSAGMGGDLGLLSIDIDGNDYWVWKAITVVAPRIVVVEYNSIFGPLRAVSVPYDAAFQRQRAHSSWLYAGASLAALVHLGEQRGYAFVGSNSAGNNAFFVRRDVLGGLRPLDARAGWVESTIRESRDERGEPTFLDGRARLETIADMPLVDVTSGRPLRAGELLADGPWTR